MHCTTTHGAGGGRVLCGGGGWGGAGPFEPTPAARKEGDLYSGGMTSMLELGGCQTLPFLDLPLPFLDLSLPFLDLPLPFIRYLQLAREHPPPYRPRSGIIKAHLFKLLYTALAADGRWALKNSETFTSRLSGP